MSGIRTVLAFVFAAALGAVTLSACAKKGGPGGPGAGGFTPPPMPVEMAPVSQGRVQDEFTAVGTVEAAEAIQVVSEIDGKIISLPFKEGAPIRKGGLIAHLDDVQARAEVARTEALLAQTQVTFDRTKAIVEKGAGAAADLDVAQSNLKVAEANLAVARDQLTKTHITAPFAGLLGSRKVSPGAFIRSGEPITDLAAIDELKVTFAAPERYLGSLQVGAGVTVSTPAFPGYELQGAIDVIEPVLDQDTRSARIIARVRNPDRRFRPGMSADVAVVLGARQEALTVPSESIFAEGNQSYVYVIKPDSTVARTAIQLGTRMAGAVEVTAGLEPGQRVVRTGHQKLFDGARVMPIMSQSAPGGPTGAPAGAGAGGGR